MAHNFPVRLMGHLFLEIKRNFLAIRAFRSYSPNEAPVLDGIDPSFLWHLNCEADRPDLAVILETDPDTIAERLAARGPHNRFQLTPGSSHAEAHFYRQATERLIQAGFDVLRGGRSWDGQVLPLVSASSISRIGSGSPRMIAAEALTLRAGSRYCQASVNQRRGRAARRRHAAPARCPRGTDAGR